MPARFEGVTALRRKLAAAAKRVDDEAGRTLVPEAEHIRRQAQARTPVDEGDLRDSFEVSKAKKRRGVISVEITAGGAKAPHGAKVHEDLEAHHTRGEAKFLERPTLQARGSLLRKLGRRFSLRKVVR